MKLFYIAFLLFFINITKSSIYPNIRKNNQPFIKKTLHNDKTIDIEPNVEKIVVRRFIRPQPDVSDVKRAKNKAKIIKKVINQDQVNVLSSEITLNSKLKNQHYHMDPVLNQLRRRAPHTIVKADSTSDDSSSLELQDWKDEFNDYWIQKKFEAVNSTDMRGDVVNMVAARPWGVPCGDPNQHDVPWGSCMLPMECDAEYRIYRGDYSCGNTEFVCCALQTNTYDLNQGFDVSFADSSFSTDSEEKKSRDNNSNGKNKRNKDRLRKKRRKERRKQKRQMKKNIRRIVHEIRKILNRSFRNATQHRKNRTKLLKKYIKDLKSQYIKDSKSVRDIHRDDMIRIDEALKDKLNEIRDLNKNFLMNSTFRDIIAKGTMNKTGARMLVEAYPELTEYLRSSLRRGSGGIANSKETNDKGDFLEYDIEYGALYY